MTAFTAVPYLYICEGNYKAGATVYVGGRFSSEQRAAIEAKLEDGWQFIPTQVGLRALQSDLPDFPNDGDHVWHHFEQFAEIEALPVGQVVTCSADEFAARFAAVKWDLVREYERLGLDDID